MVIERELQLPSDFGLLHGHEGLVAALFVLREQQGFFSGHVHAQHCLQLIRWRRTTTLSVLSHGTFETLEIPSTLYRYLPSSIVGTRHYI